MQDNDKPRGRSVRPLPLHRIREAGSSSVVQFCPREGGELEQESGKDRPHNLSKEHNQVLREDSYGYYSSYSREEEIQEEVKKAKEAIWKDYIKEINNEH